MVLRIRTTATAVAVAVLTCLALLVLAASAQARSEHAVFALTVDGRATGAWLNPVGWGCLGEGKQEALRGSMRESLRVSSPRPTLVTISGLNGKSGPLRLRPLDRGVSAPPVTAEVTRDGSVEYLDCRKDAKAGECPEDAARTRASCHVPRAVQGMEGCFGTRRFATTAGIAFSGGEAMVIVSPPSGLDTAIFGCEPEDIAFRPSALIPGSTSLRTYARLPRSRLQRARAGTEIVLRGPDVPGRGSTTGCKAPSPATCERWAGEVVAKLRFVCRARRTTERCATRPR